MATEYRSIEYRLHECLVQIQEMISILGFDQELLDSINECKDLIKSKQYNIAVMGEFKRGKSSLINAMLGAKILPADATPTTATVNRITYGTTPKAVITFQDGSSQEIGISELGEYVTKEAADGKARALRIKEATVYFPTVICQNHIDLIDTPGLNDEERMTRITIDMIANVDAVLVPIHARAPFSETEKKFVCQLIESEGIHNLVFAVTFLDQLDEDDYDYEEFMEYLTHRIQSEVFAELNKREGPAEIVQKAHLLLDHLQICGVSSYLALESFVSNNREMRKKSRFEEFSSALLHTATARQMENAARKTVGTVRTVVSQFDSQDSKHREALMDQFRTLERGEDTFRRYCADAPKVLDTIFFNDYEKLQALSGAFNSNKNWIVGEYIRRLSQIRENTHEVILGVLNRTAAGMSEEIEMRCRTLQKAMVQVMKDSLSSLQKRERETLDSIAPLAGISEKVGFDETAPAMGSFADTIFSNAVFSWRLPLSQVSDLRDCNVIELVIQAADSSISDYIGELEEIQAAIRRNWFRQFSTHIDSMLARGEETLAKKREALDLQYKAYLRNYQMFYQDSKDILSRCEVLCEEINGGKSHEQL